MENLWCLISLIQNRTNYICLHRINPLPLGVLTADRPAQITIHPAFADQARRDAILAVSLEPPGGSPTGQPTGPVIGSGRLTNL